MPVLPLARAAAAKESATEILKEIERFQPTGTTRSYIMVDTADFQSES
jgi:hypothetical protein